MKTRTDHLVIAADNLGQGVKYVKETLGVEIPFGGIHMKMGTHNHVMKLGEDIFLEIISINPEIPSPAYPRWFALDEPAVKAKIKEQPALLTWVVNTKDINSLVKKAAFPAGKPEHITRGSLSWHFALPEDGRLFAGGMLPYIIQWHTDAHPAGNMADLGCKLERLEIYHPYADWLKDMLRSIDTSELAAVIPLPKNSAPYIAAHINTPAGVKIIKSLQ